MNKYYFNTIDSTNNEAKRIIKSGVDENFYILADSQTEGKGQFERKFFSPSDTGLYLSVCLKLNHKLSNSFITQAAAVAVCESAEELFGVKLRIKPVNDIIYAGRKVGGILVETTAQYSKEDYFAVFGIGLNLYKPDGGFPQELKYIAGYIFDNKIDKNALIEKIIDKLQNYSFNFQSHNIMNNYLERLVSHERKN